MLNSTTVHVHVQCIFEMKLNPIVFEWQDHVNYVTIMFAIFNCKHFLPSSKMVCFICAYVHVSAMCAIMGNPPL